MRTVRPLIGIVEHLRRELAWGMSPLVTPPNLTKVRKNRVPATAEEVRRIAEPMHGMGEPGASLGQAILHALEVVESLIRVAFGHRRHSGMSTPIEKASIQEATDALIAARDATREGLKQIFDELDAQQQETGEYPEEMYDRSLAIIALLQVCVCCNCLLI